MDYFDVWAVAAAILATRTGEDAVMHYEELAVRIVRSGLTTLGLKGSTPAQTVGATLRKHSDLFNPHTNGFYSLRNQTEVITQSEVERAIQALKLLSK